MYIFRLISPPSHEWTVTLRGPVFSSQKRNIKTWDAKLAFHNSSATSCFSPEVWGWSSFATYCYVTSLSNMVWFWNYWICFLAAIIEIDCKVSTLRRFQKYWIRKALFHKGNPGSSIQYLKKEVILDICLKKCFYEVRNPYLVLKKRWRLDSTLICVCLISRKSIQ